MSDFFPADTVASLRALNTDAMPDVCQIYHQTATPNALREVVISYPSTPSLADVPCRVKEPTDDDAGTFGETIEALKESLKVVAILRVALGTDIRQTDRVEVLGSRYRVAKLGSVTAYSTVRAVALRLEN